MRKYILPPTGGAYKANLHCHSNISDGRCSVEELKTRYMQKGYSIIAYTDHDVLVDHRDLCDENFLALNGYEMEVNGPAGKTCHMCLVAKDQDNLTQVCYNKDKYVWGNARAFIPGLKFYQDDYERQYSHEGICDMMKKGRDAGFFVTYNHPAWSLEDYTDYSGYEGMHAMEIWNTGCAQDNNMDMDALYWDDLLGRGIRLYGVAVDDGHAAHAHCKGWVMVNAENNVNSILKALENGAFYSSCGPEIYDFYVKDGHCVIECSPVKKLRVHSDCHPTKVWHDPDGKLLTYAAFDIESHNQDYGYVRMSIMDENGNYAWTNPIFLD